MARQGERTFLVESYVPRLDEAIAAAITSRLRAVLRQLEKEGTVLRWLQTFALVGEETYFCLVAGSDVDDVVQVSQRAGLDRAHVVEVLAIEPRGGR